VTTLTAAGDTDDDSLLNRHSHSAPSSARRSTLHPGITNKDNNVSSKVEESVSYSNEEKEMLTEEHKIALKEKEDHFKVRSMNLTIKLCHLFLFLILFL
jgi:hypothetical protein